MICYQHLNHSQRSRSQDGYCRSSYWMRGFRNAIVPIVNAAYGQFHALIIDVTQHAVGAIILIDAAPVVGSICDE